MPQRPPTVKRGEPRRASTVNQMASAVRSFGLYVSWPLKLTPRSSGFTLGIDAGWYRRHFARVLSGPATDHSYQVKYIKRDAVNHLWVDIDITKTAFEMNDVQDAAIIGQRVELLSSGIDIIFQLQPCTP